MELPVVEDGDGGDALRLQFAYGLEAGEWLRPGGQARIDLVTTGDATGGIERRHVVETSQFAEGAPLPVGAHGDGDPVVAAGDGIGAGGGPMIISGVLQVLINYMTFGMDLTNAQQAPRVHCHGDLVEVEGWLAKDVVSRLEDYGHEVRVFGDRARVRWAGGKVADEGPPVARRVMPCIVQCAAREAGGGLDVAADPRGPGDALILGKHDSGLWAER